MVSPDLCKVAVAAHNMIRAKMLVAMRNNQVYKLTAEEEGVMELFGKPSPRGGMVLTAYGARLLNGLSSSAEALEAYNKDINDLADAIQAESRE